MFHIKIDSGKGDRFLIHLPKSAVAAAAEDENACSIIKASRTLNGLDLKEMCQRIENSEYGLLFSLDNEDGDHIEIEAER